MPKTASQRQAFREIQQARAYPVGSKRLHNAGPGLQYFVVKVPYQRRWVLEHRVIMQEHVGRPLERSEHVHHLNGNGLDNRIENLQLLSAGDHTRIAALENVRLKKGIYSVPVCESCGWRHPPH